MVTIYQVHTGQHAGHGARLDWVHSEPAGDDVTIHPLNRFGRGLRVRVRRTSEGNRHDGFTTPQNLNPSVDC